MLPSTQLQAQLDYCSTGAAGGVLAAEVSQLNLAIRDCAAELERCVHEENAAEVKLFVGRCKQHFPIYSFSDAQACGLAQHARGERCRSQAVGRRGRELPSHQHAWVLAMHCPQILRVKI